MEWYSTFGDFENGHYICCQSGLFLWVQFQQIGEFGLVRVAHAQQGIHFQKITGTLYLLIPSFNFKEQSQK